MIGYIIFISVAALISILFYKHGRDVGYIGGVDDGYALGWSDGVRQGRKSERRGISSEPINFR